MIATTLKSKKLSLLFLIAITLATMIRFDRPLVRGDGVAYLAWVDSLALDHDFDLENQAERLSPVNTYAVILNWHNGKYGNAFPFGVAFLQYPFYRIGHIFLTHNWLNLNPDYFHAMQGVELPYSFWVMVGANLMTLCAVILVWLTIQRFCHIWLAALLSWAVFIGSPLFYYTTVSPLNSHNPGAFSAAWLFYLAIQVIGSFDKIPRQKGTGTHTLHWIEIGVSAGLMTLSRWQLLLVAVPLWGLFAWYKQWKGLSYATAAAAITLLPLPLIWNYLFDSPFIIPYDILSQEPFFRFPINSGNVFLHTLYHSPILILSLVGLAKLWKRNHIWATALALIILFQVLINGAALDWWGGETYGMRRMSELYFVYALLGAVALGHLSPTQGAERTTAIILRVALIVLILYNFLYIFSFFSYTWTSLEQTGIPTPKIMISYFLRQSTRWEVIAAIFRTHLGPPAWSMPGP